MTKYCTGDYVKVEFKDESVGESEWMWVQVDSCDDRMQLIFGRLDNRPVALAEKLKLHSEVAVSYRNVRDHRLSSEFTRS
jgi:hypothetical protein